MSLTVQTVDGVSNTIPFELAFKSEFLKNMYEDLGHTFPPILELEKVTTKALAHILKWFEIRSNNGLDENVYDYLETLDFKNDLEELLLVTDFLLMDELFQDCIKFVARKIRQMNVSEIQAYFGTESDFDQNELEVMEALSVKTA